MEHLDHFERAALPRLRSGLFVALGGIVLAGCVVAPPPEAIAAPPAYAQAAPGPAYAPAADYQPPPGPGYGSPAPAYEPPAPAYAAPGADYAARPGYGAPAPGYGAPASGYAAPGGGLTREQFIERRRAAALRKGRDPEHAAAMAARRFEMMDTDADGILQPAERAAWRAAHAWRRAPYGGMPQDEPQE